MKIKRAYFKYGLQFATNELAKQIMEFTKDAKGAVFGLSGGIDSSLTAALTAYAFNNSYPKKETLGLIMPSNANNPDDTRDGIRVAKALGIEYKIIPIEPIAQHIASTIPEAFPKYPDVAREVEIFHNGNLCSEARALVLSRYAAANNYRVMGTGNKDEDYVLGYFTKRGDGAVDNNILGDLSKRLVRELAAYHPIPKDIVERASTAGLWQDQTDEGELGYKYEVAEWIKNGIDQGLDKESVQKETGYDMNIIEDVLHRHKTTEHKRTMPPIGKVTLEWK